jgi:hypothetical protein
LVASSAGSSSSSGNSVSKFFKGKWLAPSADPNTFYVVTSPPAPDAKSASFLVAMAITQWNTGVWLTPDGKLFRFGNVETTSAKNKADGFVLVAQPAQSLRVS